MRIIAGAAVIFVLPAALYGQAPDTLWTATFGGSQDEQCYDCIRTADGGYMMVGYTRSFGAGDDDVWMVKTDGDGTLLWYRTFGGTSSDRGYSVCQTCDGGYIIGGWSFSFGPGVVDAWVIKTDSLGDLEWDSCFGTENGFERCYSIIQAADSSYVFVGETDNNGTTFSDIWLVKIDREGDLMWDSTFGGSSDDYGIDVIERSDGGYALTGWTYISGYTDTRIISTDESGTMLHESVIGYGGDDRGWDMKQLSDGGFLIAGETSSTVSGKFDAWLVRTDNECVLSWDAFLGTDEDDYGSALEVLSSGEYAICGRSISPGANNENLWVVLTDTTGSVIWDMAFGGSGTDAGHSVHETDDGGLVMGGYTSSFGSGGLDMWLLKTEEFVSVEQRTIPAAGSLEILSADPNPFNCTCSIVVSTDCAGPVDAAVYSVDGRRIATLEQTGAGSSTRMMVWNGRDDNGTLAASGMYLLQVTVGGEAASTKLYLLR
ncbi:MAG: T9SS type A sorting domain-containing protein [Candidatus Fermentibacteraceae bacterium]|nr:T9SS type A sorting domain-containing protein [Candidatus Fermentibacteraceae bacterium]MBN2607874.1 T9SS type A sorting domain-containing protein [Candidatus Fermentibacteraceae bacterium]